MVLWIWILLTGLLGRECFDCREYDVACCTRFCGCYFGGVRSKQLHHEHHKALSSPRSSKMISNSINNIMTPPPPSLPVAPSISRLPTQWDPNITNSTTRSPGRESDPSSQRDLRTKNNNPNSRSLLVRPSAPLHRPFPLGGSSFKGGRFEGPLNSQIRLAVVNRGVVGPAVSRTDASRDWQQHKHWAEGSGLPGGQARHAVFTLVVVNVCLNTISFLVLCCQAHLLLCGPTVILFVAGGLYPFWWALIVYHILVSYGRPQSPDCREAPTAQQHQA